MKTYTTEQEEIINAAVLLRYIDLSNQDNIATLAAAYQVLFDSALCVTCTGDILNGYYRINSHFNNPIKFSKPKTNTTMTQDFILKGASIIIDAETGEMYSNANLTDEIAMKILKDKPSTAKRFEKLPAEFSEPVEPKVQTGASQLADALKWLESNPSKKEMAAVCTENGFPDAEWNRLNAEKLRAYITAKISE